MSNLLSFAGQAWKFYGWRKDDKGNTYCNEFIQSCAFVTGYTKLAGMLANEIVEYCEISPDWVNASAKSAQHYANEGNLVIAGWQSDTAGRGGHVCLVIPGELRVSGLHGQVPMVCNVGNRNFYNLHAGYAFSKECPPRYWVCVSSQLNIQRK